MPFTTSEIKSYLTQANRTYDNRKTWEQMYGALDYAQQVAESNLQTSYADAIGQAYESSLKSAQDIASSNVGTAYKTQAMIDNENAVLQAYEAYKQQYSQNLQTLQQTMDTNKAQIDTALTTEAENMNKLYESIYDYLQYLYDNYEDFANDEVFKQYLDEEGSLLTREVLENKFYNTTNISGDKELSVLGKDFYNTMLNYAATSTGDLRNYSYGTWLSKQNPELFEWARSANPYDYETSRKKIDMFQKAFTDMSTDQYENLAKPLYDELNSIQYDDLNNTHVANDIRAIAEKYKLNSNIYTSTVNEIDKLDNELKKRYDLLKGLDNTNDPGSYRRSGISEGIRTLQQQRSDLVKQLINSI